MLQLITLIALLTQTIAAPQGGPAEPVSNPSTNVIQIAVGQDGLSFTPSNVTANNGDTVVFNFPASVKHSVTQSAFASPCTPLQGGFNSGLQGSGAQFNLTIEDTKPIWFYCQQTTPAPHCGMGMVGSINAPSSGNTFDNFLAAASSIGSSEPAQTPTTALTGVGATATLLTASAGTDSASGGTNGTTASGGTNGTTTSGGTNGTPASGGASGAVSTSPPNPSSTSPSSKNPTSTTTTSGSANKTNTAGRLVPKDGMMITLAMFMGALAL